MRKITISKFRLNIYQEAKNLPVMVTRDGKNYFEAVPVGSKPVEDNLDPQYLDRAILHKLSSFFKRR